MSLRSGWGEEKTRQDGVGEGSGRGGSGGWWSWFSENGTPLYMFCSRTLWPPKEGATTRSFVSAIA